MDFKSFTNKSRLSVRNPPPENPQGSSIYAGIDIGAIEILYPGPVHSYRADIRLISGETLSRVRLPGPVYDPTGKFTGFKIPFMVGQMVIVGYRANRFDSPICLAVMPFPTMPPGTQQNLQADAVYNPLECSAAHSVGHKTVWSPLGVQFLNSSTQNVVMLVDCLTGFIQLGGVPAVEGVAKGATLESYLFSLYAWVSGLYAWALAPTHLPPFPGPPPPAPPAPGPSGIASVKVFTQ